MDSSCTTQTIILFPTGLTGVVPTQRNRHRAGSRSQEELPFVSIRLPAEHGVGWQQLNSRAHESVCVFGTRLWGTEGRLADLLGAWVQGEKEALSSQRCVPLQHRWTHWPWSQVSPLNTTSHRVKPASYYSQTVLFIVFILKGERFVFYGWAQCIFILHSGKGRHFSVQGYVAYHFSLAWVPMVQQSSLPARVPGVVSCFFACPKGQVCVRHVHMQVLWLVVGKETHNPASSPHWSLTPQSFTYLT